MTGGEIELFLDKDSNSKCQVVPALHIFLDYFFTNV